MRIAPIVALAGLALTLAGGLAPVRADPDRTLGMAIMSATVKSDGSLVVGAGVVGPVQVLDTGRYQVTFNRSLVGCTVVASLSEPDGIDPGYAAAGRLPEFNWIQVWTYSTANQLADRSFGLIVFCAQ